MTPVEVDLNHLALGAVRAFEPDAARAGLTVATVLPPEPVTVRADPDRLSQVIANLLENAGKFARSSISVQVHVLGGHAELSVDDDGPGIADEDLPHVFERLYIAQHRPVRSESGSGLGLAIVRQLTDLMGGTVSAGRGIDGGASLTVSFPLP
jgi:two-component system sensor histidine kinase MprB